MSEAQAAAVPVAPPAATSNGRERLSAMHAGRRMAIAMRSAPAIVAGVIAGLHVGRLGTAIIVALCCGAVAGFIGSRRWPLHLMPVAGVVVLLLMPALGLAAALLIAAAAPPTISAIDLLPSLFGAWVVTALGRVVAHRLRVNGPIRVGVIGSQKFTQSLRAELRLARIEGYELVGWIGSREGARVATVCLGLPVRLIGVNQFYEELFAHVPLGTLDATWFRYVLHPSYREASKGAQRVFAAIASAVASVLTAPIVLVAAIAVKLESPGPVLFRQARVGAGGEEFEVLRLRTMYLDAEGGNVPRWTAGEDERVTRVGAFLRRTHIDELPQLWNVVRNKMTLVGPRPEQPEFVATLERQLRFYDRRQLMRPGITGWAQVRCGYAGSEVGTAWKLAHDLYYLKHRSVLFDALILLETLATPIRDRRLETRQPDERFILEALRASSPDAV